MIGPYRHAYILQFSWLSVKIGPLKNFLFYRSSYMHRSWNAANHEEPLKTFTVLTCIKIWHTLVCISEWVAMQSLHFLRAKPTPILNPPSWWAARVSQRVTVTVPWNLYSCPATTIESPSYICREVYNNHFGICKSIQTFLRVLTSWINGRNTASNPYFSKFGEVTRAISWIARWVDLSSGLMFPRV